MGKENRYLFTLSFKPLRSFCKSRKSPINHSSIYPQEDAGNDVPKIEPPQVKETPTPPAETNPKVDAALDSGVEIASGLPISSLLFGFIFVAGCAALFVKLNGWKRISKAVGIGKYRYRRAGDTDLEQ